MRRLLALTAVLATCVLVSGLAYAARISRVVTLTPVLQVPTGLQTPVCASAVVTFVNVNNLRWTLRPGRGSRLKLLPGMTANCREYYAPAVAGWDRITVTYRYRGNKYFSAVKFANPSPTRP